MTSDYKGLKVIIAESECQLEKQRKLRPVNAAKLTSGERLVRVKYGVDEDTCTGDHSCIRISGCPTLTIKDNPDPLRRDPVATVIVRLRRLRPVRRERARGGAVPVVLPGGSRAEPDGVGSLPHQGAGGDPVALHAEAGGPVMSALPRPLGVNPDRRPRGRRRRRAGRLAGGGGDAKRSAGAGHVDSRRRAAHRRDHLLRRDLPGQARSAGRARTGHVAHPEPGQRRHHGRLRVHGGRPGDAERLRHARPHRADRLLAPLSIPRSRRCTWATAASTRKRSTRRRSPWLGSQYSSTCGK